MKSNKAKVIFAVIDLFVYLFYLFVNYNCKLCRHLAVYRISTYRAIPPLTGSNIAMLLL